MIKQAVILAGGKGTRLEEIARDVPKPMIPVLGKPIIEHQVIALLRYGVTDIIMITGHMSRLIEDYFGDGSRFGVKIRYYIETVPLGTTGGIKMVEDILDDEFFVLYGDVMMEVDFARMMAFHSAKNSQCTLALHPNDHPYDSDLVEIDSDARVIAFHPKPHPQNFEYHNLVNAALYVLSRPVVDNLECGVKADFGKDVFPKIAGNLRMYGYVTPEYMKDVGTPERLREVERDLADGQLEKHSLAYPRPAIFLDRDGVLNHEINLLHHVEQMEILPRVPEAVGMINRSEYLSIVVTNQPVVARNLCSLEELDAIHKRLETKLGEKGAWLDAIEFCPHHPDRGFPGENEQFKIDCECRKPKTGMIERAVKRFNIRLDESWIIGDSERDIECGRRAGLHTVGLRTGHGCRDVNQSPDYMFEDLYEAVRFIVDDPYAKYWTEINNELATTQSSPMLILIAGQSRSGKSIFAQWLKDQLLLGGKTAFGISMDQWLIPANERTEPMNVYDRYGCEHMRRDMERLLSGECLLLPGYNAATRERNEVPQSLSLGDGDCLIVDGVVALHDATLRSRATLAIVVRTEQEVLRRRFESFYSWKGMTAGEIATLWGQRQLDEQMLVEMEYTEADIVIDCPIS